MVKQTLNYYEAPSVEVIRLTFRDTDVLCSSPTEGSAGGEDSNDGTDLGDGDGF